MIGPNHAAARVTNYIRNVGIRMKCCHTSICRHKGIIEIYFWILATIAAAWQLGDHLRLPTLCPLNKYREPVFNVLKGLSSNLYNVNPNCTVIGDENVLHFTAIY